ncbi:MAG: alpha/beta fold hydrolase [Bacteroidota bacterium]|nr:alpha/beta fold hydrolase [Bacteroidota bacterium]
MKIKSLLVLVPFLLLIQPAAFSQTGVSPVLQEKDLSWNTTAKAGFTELQIPTGGSLVQGFILTPNGSEPHPTLLLLHGYPGNERNLDLAQAVRAHGWNVLYFDYRGSWGSQGVFSFRHCVEDVKNVVAFCKANAARFHIDTNRIALFGHSMGGFVCLQSIKEIPGVQKGFALSTWDIYQQVSHANASMLAAMEKEADDYFVLNKPSGKALFAAVMQDPDEHELTAHPAGFKHKQIVMLDEHTRNKTLAASIQNTGPDYFSYEVWKTDHPFTNKRISLINKVLSFLDR